MIKKIFVCASLCIMVCSIVACTNCITPNPLTDNGSLTSQTQPATSESTELSTPTQSAEESFEPSPTLSTTSESTELSTPSQSEKPTNSGDVNMNDTYNLIVKGKEIATTNHMKFNYEYHYAEIPLITIMKELGAKVEWSNKTTAKIILDEKEYILDTAKGSLVEAGNTFNVLIVAPGSKHGVFYRVVGNEFIIDSDSAKMFLINAMGAKITIDYDDRIVNIS